MNKALQTVKGARGANASGSNTSREDLLREIANLKTQVRNANEAAGRAESELDKMLLNAVTLEQMDPEEVIVRERFQNMYDWDQEKYEIIKEKMIKFGFLAAYPIVIWKEGKVCMDGHHRLFVARELGIMVVVVYLSFPSEDDAYYFAWEDQQIKRNLDDGARMKSFHKIGVMNLRGKGKTPAKITRMTRWGTTKAKQAVHILKSKFVGRVLKDFDDDKYSMNRTNNKILRLENKPLKGGSISTPSPTPPPEGSKSTPFSESSQSLTEERFIPAWKVLSVFKTFTSRVDSPQIIKILNHLQDELLS